MKDKTIKIILGIAIIAIWGTIVNRIMNGNRDEGIIIPPKTSIKTQTATIDKFQLFLNYEDPFLTNNFSELSTNVEAIDSSLLVLPPKITPPTPLKKIVRFPLVEYQGMSKNNSKYEAVAVVRINRKPLLVRIGDKKEDVTIVEIYKDSIKIEKEGEFKTYERGAKAN